MSTTAFDLNDTYVHLEDGPTAARIEVGPDFSATIARRTDVHGGRPVLITRSDADWPHWEMHPAGDEIVCLLSGSADLVLDEAGGERIVPVRGRTACVVPRGVWHRAIVHEPSETLHI